MIELQMNLIQINCCDVVSEMHRYVYGSIHGRVEHGVSHLQLQTAEGAGTDVIATPPSTRTFLGVISTPAEVLWLGGVEAVEVPGLLFII